MSVLLNITPTSDSIPPHAWAWAVMGLCAAISALSIYIAKQAEQRRSDHKEERDALLRIVQDNTQAMTRLTTVVDRVQETLDHFIYQDPSQR